MFIYLFFTYSTCLKADIQTANTGRNNISEPPLKAVGYGTGGTHLELFNSFVENNNILDQFLNNEEAKYFNTQVGGADRQLKKILLDLVS
jgi:hypothetical protein